MIFDLGFVHADPHPGNVLVHLSRCFNGENSTGQQPPPPSRLLLSSISGGSTMLKRQDQLSARARLRLSLLDHGLYCSLTEKFRCTYARLWLAMQRGDIAAVTACANDFGVGKLAGLLAVILSLRSEDRCASNVKSISYPKSLSDVFLLRLVCSSALILGCNYRGNPPSKGLLPTCVNLEAPLGFCHCFSFSGKSVVGAVTVHAFVQRGSCATEGIS